MGWKVAAGLVWNKRKPLKTLFLGGDDQ